MQWTSSCQSSRLHGSGSRNSGAKLEPDTPVIFKTTLSPRLPLDRECRVPKGALVSLPYASQTAQSATVWETLHALCYSSLRGVG